MICQVCIAENRIFEKRQVLKTVSFHAFSLKKRRFFALKAAVSSARNVGMSLKKRRFLKLISLFVGIKKVYYSDYQCLSCNAKNKRFSPSKDNMLANTDCFCDHNSLFVDFIHIYRMGVIYPKTLSLQYALQ